MRAFLGKIGGREVDGNSLGGESEAHAGHSGAHPLLGFADGLVGEAYKVEGGKARRDGALHLDEPGLDALKSHRVGVRDHGGEPWAAPVAFWLTRRSGPGAFRQAEVVVRLNIRVCEPLRPPIEESRIG